jgi:hypothetical protein
MMFFISRNTSRIIVKKDGILKKYSTRYDFKRSTRYDLRGTTYDRSWYHFWYWNGTGNGTLL